MRQLRLLIWVVLPFCGLSAAGADGFVERALPKFDYDYKGRKHPATYGAHIPAGKSRKRPLFVYLHGGGGDAFNKQGSKAAKTLWPKVAAKKPYVFLCPNGQQRGWFRPSPKHCVDFIIAAIEDLATQTDIDTKRVLISGGSAGANFIYSSGIQAAARAAEIEIVGCLPIVPGPSVERLAKGGKLAALKDWPFFHVCGRLDTIRKASSWHAHRAMLTLKAKTAFYEMPDKGHEYPTIDDLLRCIGWFETLGAKRTAKARKKQAADALAAGDLRRAAALYRALGADKELERIAKYATRRWAEVAAIDPASEPGKAVEAAWQCMIHFDGFPEGKQAAQRLQELRKMRLPRRSHGNFVKAHRWRVGTPE